MRITGLNVENYGPFAGLPPMDLSRQLTIITGPNEAGKSALRAFMWMVLFGRKRSNAPGARYFNYSHAGGGVGRGSMQIESDGRGYTVRRSEGSAPMVSDDETTSGAELLNTLIGRIDGGLYQRVFSINLTELQDLDLLTDEQVKGRIYSAGFGLGAVSLPDIKKAIENERSTSGGLWSDRKGRLRAELEDLDTRTEELERARSELQEYESLNGEIAALSVKIDTTEKLRRAQNTERERLKRVEDLRVPWEALGQLRSQLRSLPDTSAFPPDGIDHLKQLTSDITLVSGTIRDGDLEQAKQDARMEELPFTESFGRHRNAIQAVVDETVSYERLVRDLPGREQVRLDVELELATGLRSLGQDWDESRVSAFTDTAGARVEVRRAGKDLDAAIKQQDKVESAVHVADGEMERQRRDLQSALSNLEKLGDTPLDTAKEIETRRGLLIQLRRANSDRESYTRDVRDIETRAAIPGSGRPIALPRALPVVAALTGVSLVAWGVITNEMSGIAGGGIALAAAVPLWFMTGPGGVEETPDSGQSTSGHIRELRALLAKATTETARLAEMLGLESTPASRDVQLALDEVGLDLEARGAFEERQEVAHAAGEALKETEAELRHLAEESSAAADAAGVAGNSWRETLRHWTLGEGLDLTAANDVIASIETLDKILAKADSERQRVDGIAAEIDRIDRDLASVMEATGSPVPPRRQGLTVLNELKRLYEADRDARVALRTFKQSARDWATAREVHQKQFAALEITRSNLIAAAGVESEDDFRRLGEDRTTRVKIDGQVRDRETDHPLLVSPEGESYREELARLTSEEVNVRISELEDEFETLNVRGRELYGERSSMENDRKRLEESNPVAALQSDIEVLTEQVRADADRWAVLTIAGQLIEKASRRFQDQRQAPLLRSASGYFGRMTIGEYSSIQEVIGEDRLQVLHQNGTAREVAELSRATVEQLFLALRFALIEEYCRNTEPMPVLLDDVLVDFDPDRARAAASAIVELSQRHQVIALTCHPATVATFQEAATAAGVDPPNVVNLNPGAPELLTGPAFATPEQPAGPTPDDSPTVPVDPPEPPQPRMRPLL